MCYEMLQNMGFSYASWLLLELFVLQHVLIVLLTISDYGFEFLRKYY